MTRHATVFGAFEVDSMPGQSQVAICHAFVVPEHLRSRGYAHSLKELQEAELSIKHYDFGLCTVAAGNARQKSVLTRAGWQKLSEFRNRRSCETTELWGKAIGDPTNPNLEPSHDA